MEKSCEVSKRQGTGKLLSSVQIKTFNGLKFLRNELTNARNSYYRHFIFR